MMKHLTAAFFATVTLLTAESLTFTGHTDKNPILYKAGEEMVFTVTLVDRDQKNQPVKGRKLVWERTGDDGKKETGNATSDTPLVVKTSIRQPGFVRLRVHALDKDGKKITAKKSFFDGGAGADVNAIPAHPIPADFNQFWDAEIKKMLDTPYTADLKDVPSKDPKIRIQRFSITTLPGYKPTTGLIGSLKDAAPRSQKLYIKMEGYGFGPSSVNYNIVKQGSVFVIITRHAEDPQEQREYYKKLQNGPMKGFCFRNNNDKYQCDFYKMITRDYRAIQFAKTLAQWNRKDLKVDGGSMGGFRSIAQAALHKEVTFCNAYVPWCVDLSGHAKFKRLKGWRPDFTDTLAYFDAMNFATRITCTYNSGIGLGDYICPPSGQILLFNNLKGPKTLTVYQNMGHGSILGVETQTVTFKNAIK